MDKVQEMIQHFVDGSIPTALNLTVSEDGLKLIKELCEELISRTDAAIKKGSTSYIGDFEIGRNLNLSITVYREEEDKDAKA